MLYELTGLSMECYHLMGMVQGCTALEPSEEDPENALMSKCLSESAFFDSISTLATLGAKRSPNW